MSDQKSLVHFWFVISFHYLLQVQYANGTIWHLVWCMHTPIVLGANHYLSYLSPKPVGRLPRSLAPVIQNMEAFDWSSSKIYFHGLGFLLK